MAFLLVCWCVHHEDVMSLDLTGSARGVGILGCYKTELEDCKCNIHGRVTLHKGDLPLTTKTLKLILSSFWPSLGSWTMVPLRKVSLSSNLALLKT
ncbi:hypothetical protein MTR_7g018490 [Medicago truncatula]|uniref:Uncharacterized protein n=1 Tax=Medicago truncatula TaxID=3880 RepID=A0A072U7K1_MEDTR|nr:hypothetical protein MTR_7g018490 [Medicago truncatula]